MMIGGHIDLQAYFFNNRFLTKAVRFALIRGWNPASVLQRFYDKKDLKEPVIAFKAMYNHISSKKTIDFLQQHPDIFIIHLRRGNLLKQYVSKILMSKKRDGIWRPHSTYKLPVKKTIIDPEKAVLEMDRIMARYEHYNRLFSTHRKIELVYEDLIDGNSLTNEVTNKLCELLEVDSAPMTCDYVKSNPDNLEEIVENYAELATALKGTPHEKYLAEA